MALKNHCRLLFSGNFETDTSFHLKGWGEPRGAGELKMFKPLPPLRKWLETFTNLKKPKCKLMKR
jgi:hypothetical protein